MTTYPNQLYVEVGRALLPVTMSQLTEARCECGSVAGNDLKLHVAGVDGKTVITRVMCAKCNDALGRPA